jgi:hypothetical protein
VGPVEDLEAEFDKVTIAILTDFRKKMAMF